LLTAHCVGNVARRLTPVGSVLGFCAAAIPRSRLLSTLTSEPKEICGLKTVLNDDALLRERRVAYHAGLGEITGTFGVLRLPPFGQIASFPLSIVHSMPAHCAPSANLHLRGAGEVRARELDGDAVVLEAEFIWRASPDMIVATSVDPVKLDAGIAIAASARRKTLEVKRYVRLRGIVAVGRPYRSEKTDDNPFSSSPAMIVSVFFGTRLKTSPSVASWFIKLGGMP
jgi:hypothetical protein